MSSRSPKLVRKNLLDSINLRKPIYCGYLYKQSHIPPHVFNKRYFVLYPRMLVYYDTEGHCQRDVRSGTLSHRHKAFILDHLYLTKPEKKPNGAKFCFILHAPNVHNERHEVLLVAENREERRVWMEKLQEQNPDLLESEHTHRNGSSSSTSSSRKGSSSSTSSNSGNLLEVPKPRKLRADSVTPDSTELTALQELADETQTFEFHEGSSDEN